MTDPARQLFMNVAGIEPEELRRSYLAVPDPGRVLSTGSTVPLLGGIEMTQRESGLVVPFKSKGAQMAEMSAQYMTLEHLFGTRLHPSQVAELLNDHSLESWLTSCARLLSDLYEVHPADKTAHRRLVEGLPEPARSRALSMLKGHWLYLAPQAILCVEKLALMTDHVTHSDSALALGPAVFVALDFSCVLGADRDAGPLWWGTNVTESLAIETFQNQLFNRACDLGTELARWHRTRDLAAQYDPQAAARFDAVFHQATGCTPDVLFDVGFSSLLYMRTEKSVRVNPQIFDQLHHPADQVQAAIDLLTADAVTLKAAVTEEVQQYGIEWSANAMRRHPMLRCEDGALLVLHPQFLIERTCGTAFYWEVMNEINVLRNRGAKSSRRKADALRGAFGDFTGHAAEEYVVERLAISGEPHFPVSNKTMWREGELRTLWPIGQCCDLLIAGLDSWVPIEVVNHAITASAAAAGSLDALERDLGFIIDEKADQLNDTINRLIENGGSLPGECPQLHHPHYFPVIVAASGFPWNPLMASAVWGRLADRGLLQHPLIHRLTIITTDDVEYIESALDRGLGTIPGMLEDRRQLGQEDTPFEWYLHRHGGLMRPDSLKSPMSSAFNTLAENLGLDPNLLEDT